MAVDGVTSLSQGGGGERFFASACTGWASWVTYTTYGPQAAAVFVRARMLLMGCDVVNRTASTRDCQAVMGRKAAFLASGGYGPSSIQRHLLHFAARRAMYSSGSGSRPAVVPAVVAARACLAASGPLPACCDGGERHARRDGGRARPWAVVGA